MTDQIEKSIKIRKSFLWLPIPFLDQEINAGTTLELMPTFQKAWLDYLADGETFKHDVRVESKESVTVIRTKKVTDTDPRSEFSGEPATVTSSETHYYDEINQANIMYARGILATLVGYSKKIKWI